jgi:uncharacterized protein involved in outer membrane biogenesis
VLSQKGRKSRRKAAPIEEFRMNRRRLAAVGVVTALVTVATVAWVVLTPRWAVAMLDGTAMAQLGRNFSATGSTYLDLSPLSIRIEGASLSGAADQADKLASAASMVIPVSLSELVSRRPSLANITLREAEFALLIDERGEASWAFPDARPSGVLGFTLEQASFRYFDQRNGQSLKLSNVDGRLDIASDGAVNFRGSAVINSRIVRIDFGLKSLPRVNEDGSPIELAVETDAVSASFSGRLSTRKVLSLTGPMSFSSRDTANLARWVGIALPDGMSLPGPVNFDGSLDSAGRAYAIRNAAITLGQFRGAGDVVADLRGERLKLQADLKAETVWLDALVPASGADAASWGRAVLPLDLLRTTDAEVSILSRTAAFRGYEVGASRFAVSLEEGKLTASGASRLANGGTVTFSTKADSVVLPPSGSFSLKAENADLAPLVGVLTGVKALSGTGTLAVDVSAQGQTQEELVSTLKGTASLSLPQGQIAGTDLPGLFATVREKIVEGWSAASGNTPLTAVDAKVTLEDGLATLSSGTAALATYPLSLSGTVDLLRRALDLRLGFPQPEAAPLPVPVIIQGNWSAPRIYPDVPDILNNPQGGFARLRDAGPAQGN